MSELRELLYELKEQDGEMPLTVNDLINLIEQTIHDKEAPHPKCRCKTCTFLTRHKR